MAEQLSTQNIGSNQVTYAKIQQATANSILLGAQTSGTNISQIILGTNLSMTGSTLNAGTLSSYFVDKFTLSGTDITNQYVTLTHTPTAPSTTIVNLIKGLGQLYGTDFTITGTQLSWTGLGLQSLLASGDTLYVQYYYPAAAVGYTVNQFTLSSTDITNKYVTLSTTPTAPTLAILNVIKGLIQLYGTDFTITGTQLSWSGLGLQSALVSGDTLQVQFY